MNNLKHLLVFYFLLSKLFSYSQIPNPPSNWIEKLSYFEETKEYNILDDATQQANLKLIDKGKLKSKVISQQVNKYLLPGGEVITFQENISNSENHNYLKHAKTIYIDGEYIKQYDQNDHLIDSKRLSELDPSFRSDTTLTLVNDRFVLNPEVIDSLRAAGFVVTEVLPDVWEISKSDLMSVFDFQENSDSYLFKTGNQVTSFRQNKRSQIAADKYFSVHTMIMLKDALISGINYKNYQETNRSQVIYTDLNTGNGFKNSKLRSNNRDIIIYPNPGSNQLSYKTTKEVTQIELRDIKNKCLILIEHVSDNRPIDIGALMPGIYLVYFKTTNGTIIKKFFKS